MVIKKNHVTFFFIYIVPHTICCALSPTMCMHSTNTLISMAHSTCVNFQFGTEVTLSRGMLEISSHRKVWGRDVPLPVQSAKFEGTYLVS